eukprot:1937590-Lingulodinium_polyedra.AAC.1
MQVVSKQMTSPSAMASTAAFTSSAAVQSGAHLMTVPISSLSRFAVESGEGPAPGPTSGRP